MSYKLYLDDQRIPENSFKKFGFSVYENSVDWFIVRDYDDFVSHIKKYGMPELISFDHDLADSHIDYFFNNGGSENPPDPMKANFKEKTGYDCAKWLIELCMDKDVDFPEYLVHSMNPVGAENIKGLIESYKKFRRNNKGNT